MLSFQHALLTAAIGVLLWAVREGLYWRRQVGAQPSSEANDRHAVTSGWAETVSRRS